MLPTFLVIGALKAGTTSLYEYLRRHPRIFMAEPKEVRYFVAEKGWRRGRAWYEAQFATAGDAQAVGEASPGYSRYPLYDGVPARIAALIPDAKLVYLVRDPVARAISQYRDGLVAGRERRPPAEALLDPVYVDPSRYAFQLEQYVPHFGTEQLLLVQSEKLAADPRGEMARVASFLGLEAEWSGPDLAERYNVSEGKARRRAGTFELLRSRRARRLARRLPPRVKRALRLVTHDRDVRVEVPDGIARELGERLRADVAALREEWLGPEFDGWGLLGGPSSSSRRSAPLPGAQAPTAPAP